MVCLIKHIKVFRHCLNSCHGLIIVNFYRWPILINVISIKKECENAHWSVRELRRQNDSSLFERIILSRKNIEQEGIVELSNKGNANMEYALGGLSNKIFGSRYITSMPKKEELIRQVEMVIERKNK